MSGKNARKAVSFEEGLRELEEMAEQMEASALPLEELMKLYQRGTALAGELSQKLEAMKAFLQTIDPPSGEKPPEENEAVFEGQISMNDLQGGSAGESLF